MMKLAAFADEISPDVHEQIKICKENQVTHFELRGVYGKNVLDFDKALRQEIKTRLADNGMAVVSIGSPIGKVKINEPWPAHFERFKIAVDAAELFLNIAKKWSSDSAIKCNTSKTVRSRSSMRTKPRSTAKKGRNAWS